MFFVVIGVLWLVHLDRSYILIRCSGVVSYLGSYDWIEVFLLSVAFLLYAVSFFLSHSYPSFMAC